MTDNNKQENKTEALNEETKGKELSMEDLEQVTGGQRIPVILFPGAPPIYIGDDN